MSTIPVATKSQEVFSRQVHAGKRSFSFDVKRAPHGQLYFTISELVGKGNIWSRSRVLVPAEQARDFYMGLCEAIKAMRQADMEEPAPAPRPTQKARSAAPREAAQQPVKKVASRATGRASTAPNRSALSA